MIDKLKNMIQNIKEYVTWQPFPDNIPSKNGWYSCTVEVRNQQRYVMNLYWYGESAKFQDNIRQDVFSTYEVYGWASDTPDHRKRLFTIDLCDRTNDVVAWRREPAPYMKGFIKDSY